MQQTFFFNIFPMVSNKNAPILRHHSVHIPDIQAPQKQQPAKPVASNQKDSRKPSLKGKIQHSTELMSEYSETEAEPQQVSTFWYVNFQ